MSAEAKPPDTESPLLRRAYSWLMTVWIAYVLAAFFVIRILGSGMAQRFVALVRLRLSR